MTRKIVLWVTILFAQAVLADESNKNVTEVAGEQVQHALRPTGEVEQPAGAEIAVPPALVRDARIHEPTAAAPIVDYSRQTPGAEFTAFPDRPPPKVVPRKNSLAFYPCSRCHQNLTTNTTPRVLMPVHEVGLKHGDGRFWCLTCHDAEDRNSLHTLRGTKIDFDQAWKVCGQCHQARQKDWYYGAHGKRFYSWRGEPVRYNCTHCHNPHRPPFMHRKPQPPPPVRAGLQRPPPHVHASEPVWAKHANRMTGDADND